MDDKHGAVFSIFIRCVHQDEQQMQDNPRNNQSSAPVPYPTSYIGKPHRWQDGKQLGSTNQFIHPVRHSNWGISDQIALISSISTSGDVAWTHSDTSDQGKKISKYPGPNP
jgi:hypothetical protein